MLERLPDELENLEYLTVKGTTIRELPESLGRLSWVKRLILSNNSNLERIPESIRHLSKLTFLFISHCERLQTLPELPCNLGLLSARNCTSLEKLPAGLSSMSSVLYVNLCNFLKLDPNELSEIVKDGWMKHSLYEERGIKKSMYFPGNEIPKWFRHQSMGSSATLKTRPPRPAGYNKLISFAFCAVVVFPAFLKYFRHKSGEDDWDGNVYAVCCDWKRKSEGHLDSWFLGKISYVESDHVFLGCNSFGGEYFGPNYDEFSFRIHCSFHFPPYLERGEVKKCGIHFVYAQDSADHILKD